jgi:hypothetical protein
MKRILALFLFMGAITAASAQYSRNQSRDIVLGRPGSGNVYNEYPGNNSRYSSTRERDAQIERIKREFNWKIQAVDNDRYLRNSAKRRKIRLLENERDDRIRQVFRQYNDQNRYNNRTDRYGRRY